jgi:NADH-quinone oxidoreductase subunit G
MYTKLERPPEVFEKLMDRQPRLLMDIHNVSEVNKPEVDLSKINGPATGNVFNEGTHETPLLNTEYSSEKRR